MCDNVLEAQAAITAQIVKLRETGESSRFTRDQVRGQLHGQNACAMYWSQAPSPRCAVSE